MYLFRLKNSLFTALKKVTTQFIDPNGYLADRILDPVHASSMLIINNLIQLLMDYIVTRADVWNIDNLVYNFIYFTLSHTHSITHLGAIIDIIKSRKSNVTR